MPDTVITSSDQITVAWLTAVLVSNGALTSGAVTTFEVKAGRGNWSTNAILGLRYADGSQGALPQRLFLKMVNAELGGESFGPSEVTYYTRDYAGVQGTPLVRCYDAVFSEELKRYHVLLDDLSETHVEAEKKAPTIEYGLALAEGLAALHARWWGAQRFAEVGASMHSAGHIRRFVDIAESGVGHILNRFATELVPHWPDTLRALYAKHPQALIERAQDDNGFTLIHGDVGHKNVLVPRDGDRPIYIIDRQPFDWALTTWLGVYDLAYAIVLDWEVETRRRLEMPILRHYHEQLIKQGVTAYTWKRLYDDYRLCVAMSVYVATEYFRGGVTGPWVPTWLLMLQRSLTACDDLDCSELW
jgi:thiamine kinase-like enzyme